jgi:hypothetical protein
VDRKHSQQQLDLLQAPGFLVRIVKPAGILASATQQVSSFSLAAYEKPASLQKSTSDFPFFINLNKNVNLLLPQRANLTLTSKATVTSCFITLNSTTLANALLSRRAAQSLLSYG